ncbi:hypothetical protein L226DRAFT_176819 [Lentinus tigrinus ALCF2SS1-7]|uniref:uncharacterized protein n=1 Tax=Lentinus tigrinus ALCF2SS1-7 TaxID=1328758 RepID=UPI001165F0BF|nr:hypothetical protein L226DRAFT_176819 [Lentinus tigrinus ALCF2SS1-7]
MSAERLISLPVSRSLTLCGGGGRTDDVTWAWALCCCFRWCRAGSFLLYLTPCIANKINRISFFLLILSHRTAHVLDVLLSCLGMFPWTRPRKTRIDMVAHASHVLPSA